jgi:hypothetical protein
VYVELEAAPWVWRVQWPDPAAPAPSVTSHTGLPAPVQSCWLDESGRLFLDTDLGLGLVHSQDMGWTRPTPSKPACGTRSTRLDPPRRCRRFGYQRVPAP